MSPPPPASRSADRGSPRAWFVYMLECEDGSIYTGIATDVEARFANHLRGKGARYTRAHRPVRVLHVEPHPDRASAARAEYRIKQFDAAAKRRYLETRRTAADVLAGSAADR